MMNAKDALLAASGLLGGNSGGGGTAPTLISKTVTANGTYDPADDSADGYSSVHVIVQANTNALDSFVNNTLTAYSNHNLTKIRSDVFRGSSVTTFDFPNVTTIETAAFRACHIKRAFFPLATAFGEAFSYSLVESAVLATMYRWYSGVFYYCESLKSVDILNASTIPDNTFAGSTSFDTLILRGDTVTVLNSTGAFTNSPFASGKSGGTIYVPSALIASYQAATNWSTILGYPNNQIKAIEGSVYETQYADGTPIA